MQVEQVRGWLRQADASRGSAKPLRSAGRDGITVCDDRHRFFEQTTAGTLGAYDRAGQRLGTVCLTVAPEPGRPPMSRQSSAGIEEVLRGWPGSPRLSDLTDAGANETQYNRRVLRPMRHPRAGAKRHWERVVDFYHAGQRRWAMAAALFGTDERAAAARSRQKTKLLPKRDGPFRVPHAADAADVAGDG